MLPSCAAYCRQRDKMPVHGVLDYAESHTLPAVTEPGPKTGLGIIRDSA